MKVLEFIQSLIVPKAMLKHRNMKWFISIIMLLAFTYIMVLPIYSYLNNESIKYPMMESVYGFDVFNYVSDSNEITQEEKDTYNMITFEDFKKLGLVIDNSGVYHGEDIENGTEVVLKSVIPSEDEEGITTYKNYYIHIVFELTSDVDYDYDLNFDKTYPFEKDEEGNTTTEFRHFLLVLYQNDFSYRSSYEVSNNASSTKVKYYGKNMNVNFNTLSSMEELSHVLIDSYIKLIKYNFLWRSLVFVFIFPLLLALLFSWVIKDTANLKGFKEYLNIAAISSIMLVALCVIFSFIKVGFANVIFNYYSIIYSLYYFVIIIIINRRPRTAN